MPQTLTHDDLRRAAEQALARLTDGCTTVDEIAARLRAHDCIGEIAACSSCPVARWLEKQLTEAGFQGTGASVAYGDMTVTSIPSDALPLMAHLSTPRLIADFILAFDDSVYPDLATNAHDPEDI